MVMGEKFRRTSSSRIRSINGVIEISFLWDPKITLRERIVVRRGMRSGLVGNGRRRQSARLEAGFLLSRFLRRRLWGRMVLIVTTNAAAVREPRDGYTR